MTFIDFCSGIGGGRLGLELCGFKCLGFSEIDKAAIKTHKSFFDTRDELELGDLTQINPQSLPDFDLLISGFPCQSFSIVGKREGLENKEKGQIIFYLAEILKIKKPSFFILENVKGLLNHNKGQTLKEILKLLKSCGYQVFYKLLNSLDFELAQSRERVYFVGIREDKKCDFRLTLFMNNLNKRLKCA
ncbi:DNA cytosine methyltransferase [Campylobacter upsaliensis]